MSSASVKLMMLENQVNQMDDDSRIAVRTLVEAYKSKFSCGKLHHIAIDIARLENEIELENEL